MKLNKLSNTQKNIQIANSQGFATISDFAAYIESVRILRADRKKVETFSTFEQKQDNFIEKNFSTLSVNEREFVKELARIQFYNISVSKHASLYRDYNLLYNTITYSKSSKCRPLDYANVSYYFLAKSKKLVVKSEFGKKGYQKQEFDLTGILKKLDLDYTTDLSDCYAEKTEKSVKKLFKIELKKNKKTKKLEFVLVENGYCQEFPNYNLEEISDIPKYVEHASTVWGLKKEYILKIRKWTERKKNQELYKKLQRKINLAKKIVDISKIFIVPSDSLDSGNCVLGTLNYGFSKFPELKNRIPNDASSILNKNRTALDFIRVPFSQIRNQKLENYVWENLVQLRS